MPLAEAQLAHGWHAACAPRTRRVLEPVGTSSVAVWAHPCPTQRYHMGSLKLALVEIFTAQKLENATNQHPVPRPGKASW